MNDEINKIQFLGRAAIAQLLITSGASVQFKRNNVSSLHAAVLWGKCEYNYNAQQTKFFNFSYFVSFGVLQS